MRIMYLCALLLPATFLLNAQKTVKNTIEFSKDMLPLEVLSKSRKVNVIVRSDYAEIIARWKKENRKDVMNLVFGEETEAEIMIPGYEKDKSAGDTVRITFSELSYSAGTSAGTHGYEPLKSLVKVTNDKGVVIHDAVVTDKKKVDYSPGLIDNFEKTIHKMDVLAKNRSVTAVNLFLKNNYGFNTIAYELPFFDVKDKKQTYPEYHTAMEKTKAAFLEINTNFGNFSASIKEAIAIWETALKEFDETNKEARINKDVAAGTYLNLATAYTWLNEFDKAKRAFSEYKHLDEKYPMAEARLKVLMEDNQKRYENNTNY
jgi:tetratricopeptide (TPR) repeat protein